jgi:catechol 2,3-dioxygenase-like lactoylglutathione lyase family enzyme
MRKPLLTETLQVALVVRDLEAAMETYVSDYGIGPWDIYEFNPDTVNGLHEEGEPVERSWRLAIARVGQVQWELIEPIDDDSIYARFLATNGPGVHHIGVGVPDYDATLEELGGRGHDILLGGEYKGISFSYLSTDRDLGVITEIFSGAPGEDQKPDAVYP